MPHLDGIEYPYVVLLKLLYVDQLHYNIAKNSENLIKTAFLWHFFLFFLCITKLFQIAGGDYAGRQGNDRHAEDGREHTDDTPQIAGRTYIAVPNRG